jgi:CotH kinase protein
MSTHSRNTLLPGAFLPGAFLLAAFLQFGCAPAKPPGDGTGGKKSEPLFDVTAIQKLELEVAPADWQWLQAHAREEKYVPATVIHQGQRYTGAAVRYKGDYGSLLSCFDEATGARLCSKLSLKISFNEYGKGRFFGLRKLVLNSAVRDRSMTREVLSYAMYRAAGVPAPRASHATVSVNGEELGLFVLVENVDQEFLEDHFPNALGNLYKSVWPQHADATVYADALSTNEATPNVSRMMAFHSAVSGATDASFSTALAPYVDVDQLARYLAADRLVNSPDGIRGFYCYAPPYDECVNSNYYWYESPGERFALIPWDVDHTLKDVDTDQARSYANTSAKACAPVPFCVYWNLPDCDPKTETVYLRAPQCDSLYGMSHRATLTAAGTHLKTLLQDVVSGGKLRATHAALVAKVRAVVAADPNGPGLAKFDEANAELGNIIDGQEAEIKKRLAELGL